MKQESYPASTGSVESIAMKILFQAWGSHFTKDMCAQERPQRDYTKQIKGSKNKHSHFPSYLTYQIGV